MDNYLVIVERKRKEETQTLGELTIYKNDADIFDCKTMELEEDCNAKRDDAIPTGEYKVIKRHSAKYGNHFHILNVPNRSYILIHACNYSRQLLGCIGVGKSIADIDGDGLDDITSSRNTMRRLNSLLPKEFKLIIK